MLKTSKNARVRRHLRVRRKIEGSAQKPRLAVYRSNKHTVAQIIDDISGTTITAASTHEKGLASSTGNIEAAKKVGAKLAERAKEKGIEIVVFDRGGFKYHGRVAAVADAAREAGIKF